ncbi:hypothetical protein BJX68DRAFT_88501 [Aspergillus pseudodeflectus]|uniref:Uncharacterized protein n=1 Tax=Aspergillus pseudodeflectus TaxID=176178 RepID=A0ABR4L7R5_9EURO
MPTTTSNIEPAGPVLAHSLISSSASFAANRDASFLESRDPDPSTSEAWNLKLDIAQGLHSSSNIFRPGTVVAFSRLRGRLPNDNDDEFVGELPRRLLTDWLRRTPSTIGTPKSQNRTFIIHPANLTIFSPEKLLASLLSNQQPPLSRAQAISHLDSVQLFPVFDFAAALQAIDEVSDILRKTWEAHQPQDDHDHEHGNENQHSTPPDTGHSMTLIVAGLDTLTEAVIRASNAMRGTAVLSSALRTSTQLSRMHRPYLSILFVNTSGVGPIVRDNSEGRLPQSQRDPGSHQAPDDGLQSMFSVTDAPLFPSLLMRTLDQGIDTHLLMSNTRNVPVVEVIKDRVGSGVGKWCTWSSTRT